MQKLPQKLVNVTVAERGALDGATEVWAAIEAESARLEGRGRVLVRPSGTEPLVRVMVEAPDEAECDGVTERGRWSAGTRHLRAEPTLTSMCGIIGYTGSRPCQAILMAGLQAPGVPRL